MAFFGRKKTEQKKTPDARGLLASSLNRDLSSVLVRPRFTEKAVGQNDAGAYTFIVRRNATKYDVRDAVKALFNMMPRKITVVNMVSRTTHSRSRGRSVTVPSIRKATVYLKKGDTIDLT